MLTVRAVASVMALGAFGAGLRFVAAGPPSDAASAIAVDSDGQPPGLAVKPKGPMYFVWRDGDVWRVRSKTSEKAHRFGGSVLVRGGKVKTVAAAGMEGIRRRHPARFDAGRLSGDRTRIDFDLRTKGGIDGFDFRVEGSAAAIEFDLRIDGTAIPGRVQIGATGHPAPGERFALAAGPHDSSGPE